MGSLGTIYTHVLSIEINIAIIIINLALDYIPLEEQHDQFINPGQIFEYIGEEKGIQGHQNSCYLDSTVFGLFAVSDIFDNIFLQWQQDDPDGDAVKYLLWKGIVNPLRRYALHIILP